MRRDSATYRPSTAPRSTAETGGRTTETCVRVLGEVVALAALGPVARAALRA